MSIEEKKRALLRTGRPVSKKRLKRPPRWRSALTALFASGAVIVLLLDALAMEAAAATMQVSGEPAAEAGEAPQPATVQEPQAPVVGQDGTAQDSDQEEGETLQELGEPMPFEDETAGLDPFAAMLTRRTPSAVRLSSRAPQLYKTTEGDETFIFQTEGRMAYIRFPCEAGDVSVECDLVGGSGDEEVMILDAVRSPRGDVTYTDQDGAAVLRVTSNGGATLFNPMAEHAMYEDKSLVPLGGRAVLPVGQAAGTLETRPLSFSVAAQRMQRASDILNQRHDTFITFMAPGIHEGNQAVLADAVLTAAKGIDIVARDPLGNRIVAERLAVVEFVPSDRMALSLEDGALTISYNPAAGLMGRPSSQVVARYLESAL